MFREHKYLLESQKLDKFDKNDIEKYLSDSGKPNISALEDGLLILSKLLNKHFDEKVIVLIDEYDNPITKALHANVDDDVFEKIHNFTNSIIKRVMKGNNNLGGALMAGILPVLSKEVDTDLNNVSEINLQTQRYAGAYGFTEEEVNSLIEDFGFTEEKELKRWYNGYSANNITLYNPWSILMVFRNITDENPVRRHWTKSGTIKFLSPILRRDSFKSYLNKIINGDYISFQIQELTYDVLLKIKKIKTSTIIEENIVLTYLYHTGYLKKVKVEEGLEFFQVPNKEIRLVFEDALKESKTEFFEMHKAHLSSTKIENFSKELTKLFSQDPNVEITMQGVHATLKVILDDFLVKKLLPIDLVNMSDSDKKEVNINENLIQTIFAGAGLVIELMPHCGTEVLVGKKNNRIDCLMKSPKLCVVIKLKYNSTAEEGYNQIIEQGHNKAIPVGCAGLLVGLNVSNIGNKIEVTSKFSHINSI